MTAAEMIEQSRTYLGSGTYRHLAPVITEEGRRYGWRYDYPIGINLDGVNYTKVTTLDALIAAGRIELRWTTSTAL